MFQSHDDVAVEEIQSIIDNYLKLIEGVLDK